MEKAVNRLLVITAIFAALFGAAAYHFRNAEHDTANSEDRLVELCEYIDIDVLRLDVSIIPYEGKKIRVRCTNETPLDISIGDNRLSITESDKFVISVFAGQSSDFGLYIFLPRERYRSLSVYTGSGNVMLGGVDSEKISVVTDSGDVFSENTRSLSSIITDSGSIALKFDEIVEGTSVQSRSGNASMVFPEGSSVALDFETELGECRTDLIGRELHGSNMYSFNGGETLIHAVIENGILTVSERH